MTDFIGLIALSHAYSAGISNSWICHYIFGCGPVTILATAIATVPAATANKTYATVKAPLSNVRLPLELFGLLSSPIINTSSRRGITTESEPVPNDSPNAIRRQNSYVAQRKGVIPTMNTMIVVVGLSCSMGGAS